MDKVKNPSPKTVEKPHYIGHRARLKARFLEDPQAMPDYELLELFLGWFYPRKDTKPLAKELLAQHESLWRLFYKSPMANQHPGVACVRELCRRFLLKEAQEKPLLNTISKVVEYCHLTMAHLGHETFRIFYLDKKYFLVKEEVTQTGTIDEVSLYPRQIMGKALEFQASSLILVHNHPSGDPTPSQADIQITHVLEKALIPFQIRILDHLIIGQHQHFSFREKGLLGTSSPG